MNKPDKPILLEHFGRQYPSETSKQKRAFALYQCSCGKNFRALVDNVNHNRTLSCGCYNKRRSSESTIIHGLSKHPLYNVWDNMVRRVKDNNRPEFKNYGGRGITVCTRWLDVKNFIEDMYPTYSKGLQIDRKDNEGGYTPSNCRWVTPSLNAQNTRVLRKTNTSGYRGVCFYKSHNKWVAQIAVKYKRKFIGYFNTALEAAIAYDQYVIDNGFEHNINGVLHLKEKI